jgi:thymidylate synthase
VQITNIKLYSEQYKAKQLRESEDTDYDTNKTPPSRRKYVPHSVLTQEFLWVFQSKVNLKYLHDALQLDKWTMYNQHPTDVLIFIAPNKVALVMPLKK